MQGILSIKSKSNLSLLSIRKLKVSELAKILPSSNLTTKTALSSLSSLRAWC